MRLSCVTDINIGEEISSSGVVAWGMEVWVVVGRWGVWVVRRGKSSGFECGDSEIAADRPLAVVYHVCARDLGCFGAASLGLARPRLDAQFVNSEARRGQGEVRSRSWRGQGEAKAGRG